MQPAENKRRVPRKTIEKPCGVLIQGHYSTARMLQLGEGGLLLDATGWAMREGDRMLITFSIHGDSFILVRGVVRYGLANRDSYGVEFENLSFQNKREIRAFVASHEKTKPHLYLIKN